MAAINELTKGLDAVTELRCLLDQQSSPLKELCDQIIATIENGLSLLRTPDPSQIYLPATKKRPSSCSKNNETPLRKKNIKKVTITDSPFSDGYQWRKYGQKMIGNSKYQRCYYCCNSGKCKGKIQVRQVNSEEFPDYEVISTSEHTCNVGRSRFGRIMGNEVILSPKSMYDIQPRKSADIDFSWDEQALNELMSFID